MRKKSTIVGCEYQLKCDTIDCTQYDKWSLIWPNTWYTKGERRRNTREIMRKYFSPTFPRIRFNFYGHCWRDASANNYSLNCLLIRLINSARLRNANTCETMRFRSRLFKFTAIVHTCAETNAKYHVNAVWVIDTDDSDHHHNRLVDTTYEMIIRKIFFWNLRIEYFRKKKLIFDLILFQEAELSISTFWAFYMNWYVLEVIELNPEVHYKIDPILG